MMALFTAQDAASTRRLVALAGVVAALLLWNWAEDRQDQLKALTPQLEAARKTALRAGSGDLDQLQSRNSTLVAERAALEQRLRSTDTLEVAKAKLVYDLRRRCAAMNIPSCSVRLTEEASRPATGTAPSSPPVPGAAAGGAGTTNAPSLDSLGIAKVRAVVSGTFQGDEFVTLSRSLNTDPQLQWRINGLVVRNTSFELDVERHLRLADAVSPPARSTP